MSSLRRLLSLSAPSWSLGARLLCMSGALTLMVALLAAHEINGALKRTDDVAKLEQVSAVTSRLLQASESLAFERDVALSAINDRHRAAISGLRQALVEARRRSLSASENALSILRRDPNLAPWRQRLGQRLARIEAQRASIDHLLEDADASRSPSIAAHWDDEIAGFIADADGLWLELVRPFSGIDAVVTQQLHYNRFLAAIYDQSGRERSLVAGVLAQERTPRPVELARLNHVQGALDVSWANLHAFAIQGGFFHAIASVYSDAKSHYDVLHGMLDDAFYGPDAGGGVLPLSSGLWLELSDQYLESLDALRATSRAAIAGELAQLRRQALQTMAFQSAMLAGALLLCLLCILVVSRTVIKPIRTIVAALSGASRGETVDFNPDGVRRSDEIGQLVEVLHVFQSQVDIVRRTAAMLDAGERRLRAVVDNAIDGLITIDEKGDVESFNPACEALFGYSALEIIGTRASVIMPHLFDGEPMRLNEAPEARMGLSFAAASALETVARRRDGRLIPIEITLSEVALADASLLSVVVRDITQRKDAEAELHARAEALERSNKELDDFAYIASHDLKEPLRGLHNHARFLLEDNEDKLDADSIRRLNRLVALSQRMERLVNDLLYFSRLGRQDLAVHAIDLNVTVRDIEGTLDHFMAEHGARIVLPQPLPTVICDAPRVSELLRNLITNAVKYNDKTDKWIEIGAETLKPSPSGALCRQVFYVKDNGCGIAPEFHQEVFRIFKRLKAGAGEADGTGVGLTFVKKIVERHGGEIWIESTPGKGATFFFTLEASHDAHARAAA